MKKKSLRLLIILTIILSSVSCSLPFGKKAPATESGEQNLSPQKNTEVPITASPTEQSTLPFYDEFNDNENGWAVGENPGDNSDLTAAIKDGLYQWTVYSYDNSNWSIWPDINQVQNFTFVVDLRQKSKNFDDCDIGMIYRDAANGTMVTITLSNKRHSAYLFTENEGWSELSAWDSNNAIAPGSFNQLKVTRIGDLYEFFVNDQKLSEFTLSEIEKGQLGLSTDVFSADKTCEYEFDNFRVTSP
mgnify:CR=1 FL=1